MHTVIKYFNLRKWLTMVSVVVLAVAMTGEHSRTHSHTSCVKSSIPSINTHSPSPLLVPSNPHQALLAWLLLLGELRCLGEVRPQLGPHLLRHQAPLRLQDTQTSCKGPQHSQKAVKRQNNHNLNHPKIPPTSISLLKKKLMSVILGVRVFVLPNKYL